MDGWMDRSTCVCISTWSEGVIVVAMDWGDTRVAGTSCSLAVVPALCNLLSCSNSLSRELLRACGCPLFILDHQPKPVEFHQFACSYQMAVDPCLSISFVTSVCQLFVLIHSAVLHQNSDTSIRYPHEWTLLSASCFPSMMICVHSQYAQNLWVPKSKQVLKMVS